MGWLTKICGKPLWPFRKPTLKETNPCTGSVRDWYIDAHKKGVTVGLVEYYRDLRPWEPYADKEDRWHMAGTYIDENGRLTVYDVINDEIVTLSDTELEDVIWIGLTPDSCPKCNATTGGTTNYVAGNVLKCTSGTNIFTRGMTALAVAITGTYGRVNILLD